ncbi:MAG: hypothetical protein VSS52_004815 [Thiotrichaceae bacterium]|nr:hypothetical protein [Thiotrichaceae bacterium]
MLLKKLFVFVFLVTLPALTTAADKLFISPKVSLGYMSYSYKYESYLIDSEGPYAEEWEFSDNVLALGLGISLNYKQYFVDLFMQRSGAGTDKEIHIAGSSDKGDYLKDDSGYSFTRKDYSLAIGYRFSEFLPMFPDDTLSISVGYKKGQTKYDRTISYIYTSEEPTRTEVQSDSYETTGPFIGASYSWSMWDGTVSISAGIAQYTGESNYSFFVNNELDFIDAVEDNTLAYTYGLSWSKPLTERLAFSALLSMYDYKFEKNNYRAEKNYSVVSFRESMYAVRLTLQYTF